MRPAQRYINLLGPKSQLSVVGADPRVGGRLLSGRIATVVGPERMFHLLGHDSGDSAWKKIKKKSHEAGEQRSILSSAASDCKQKMNACAVCGLTHGSSGGRKRGAVELN